MKKRLSSILVPIYKLIFVFVLAVLADGIYWLFKDFGNTSKSALIFLFVFCAVWYLGTFRWKSIHLRGDTLVISNYLKKIAIPLSEVENVKASSFWGWQPQTITLTLKSESAFGKKIIYVPRGAGLHAKPFADELRQIVTSR